MIKSDGQYESFKDWVSTVDAETHLDEIEQRYCFEATPNVRKNKVEVFIGRMQPIHLGHIKIIKKMKNPVVVLVKGAKSSLDKNRNPLSAEVQSRLLKKSIPNVKIIIAKNGYLPEIFSTLREDLHLEATKLYAGEDRLDSYKKQIERANEKLDAPQKYNLEYVKTDRFTSATKVREVIRSGDEKEFKKLMPKELWDEFDFLQQELKQ